MNDAAVIAVGKKESLFSPHTCHRIRMLSIIRQRCCDGLHIDRPEENLVLRMFWTSGKRCKFLGRIVEIHRVRRKASPDSEIVIERPSVIPRFEIEEQQVEITIDRIDEIVALAARNDFIALLFKGLGKIRLPLPVFIRIRTFMAPP